MINLEKIKAHQDVQIMYIPLMPYCSTLAYIMGKNNKSSLIKITKPTKETRNDDKETKTKWAEMISKLNDDAYVSIKGLYKIETKLDTTDLFNALINAIRNDDDVKKYYNTLLPDNERPDNNIVI